MLNSRSKGLGLKSARVTALCSVLRTVVDDILFLPQEECNVWFVQTGALLQKLDRDTQKCAYKCCFAVINEKPVSTAGLY